MTQAVYLQRSGAAGSAGPGLIVVILGSMAGQNLTLQDLTLQGQVGFQNGIDPCVGSRLLCDGLCARALRSLCVGRVVREGAVPSPVSGAFQLTYPVLAPCDRGLDAAASCPSRGSGGSGCAVPRLLPDRSSGTLNRGQKRPPKHPKPPSPAASGVGLFVAAGVGCLLWFVFNLIYFYLWSVPGTLQMGHGLVVLSRDVNFLRAG